MASSDAPVDGNFRSPCYAIVSALVVCPHCTRETPVIALCMPPGHEAVDADNEPFEPSDDGCWSRMAQDAFLFHVEALPDHVARAMQASCVGYRRSVNCETGNLCWANHCGSCAAPFEDYDLYCEPEAAFMPLTRQAAAAIRFAPVARALQVRAGGHAELPPALEFLAAS